MVDYWEMDVYRHPNNRAFAERRKRVDSLKLDWLDAAEAYSSPEVILLSKKKLQEWSGWSEEDVRILFLDRRFPSTVIGRSEIVEIHALIQFFAKIEAVNRRQALQHLRWQHFDENFAQLIESEW